MTPLVPLPVHVSVHVFRAPLQFLAPVRTDHRGIKWAIKLVRIVQMKYYMYGALGTRQGVKISSNYHRSFKPH